MKTFLETFEASMKLNKVGESLWLTYLVGLLRGRAAEACQGIHYDEAGYAYARIRDYYNVTEKGQRRKVQSLRLRPEMSFENYIAESTKLVRRCLKPEEGIEGVLDKILQEALIDGLPAKTRQWVGKHRPQEAKELIELIRTYRTYHRKEYRFDQTRITGKDDT